MRKHGTVIITKKIQTRIRNMVKFVRHLLRVPLDVCGFVLLLLVSGTTFLSRSKQNKRRNFRPNFLEILWKNLRLFSHDATATGCTSLIIVGPFRAE